MPVTRLSRTVGKSPFSAVSFTQLVIFQRLINSRPLPPACTHASPKVVGISYATFRKSRVGKQGFVGKTSKSSLRRFWVWNFLAWSICCWFLFFFFFFRWLSVNNFSEEHVIECDNCRKLCVRKNIEERNFSWLGLSWFIFTTIKLAVFFAVFLNSER